MDKFERFDRQSIEILIDEIDKALNEIRIKDGLEKLVVDSVKADNISMTAKLSGRVSGNHAENFEHNMALLFADYNGLPANILKQEFISNGKWYAIMRIEPRNPKYPILARGLVDNLVYISRKRLSEKILQKADCRIKTDRKVETKERIILQTQLAIDRS